ncbi:MAG: sugar transferase, partial [Micrococcales bacterium]|nr:sugar transferase [Micrococcales bacterium]
MALVADDPGAGYVPDDAPTPTVERRAPSREPRRSWASSQPFVPRTEDNDDGRRRWRAVSPGYVRSTILSDFVLACLVAMVPTLGYGWLTCLVFTLLTGTGFVILVAGSRGYLRKSLGSAPTEFEAVLRGVLLLGLVLMAVDYLFKYQVDVPRRLVFVGVPRLWLACWADRHGRRRRLHRARERGEAMVPTLVVGRVGEVVRLVDKLRASPYHGFEPTAACLPDPEALGRVNGVDVVGGLADIVQVAVDRHIEVVVLSMSSLSGDALRRLSWALGRAKVDLVVAPDLVEVAGPRLTLRPAAGVSLLDVEVEAPRRRLLAKSVMDRCLASIGLLVASVPIALAAVAVMVTSSGGPFFRQTRVGLDGKTFTMWKIRTMYKDA